MFRRKNQGQIGHRQGFRPKFELMETRQLPSGMTLTGANVLSDGRTVQLIFNESTPASSNVPDWMPGYSGGVRLNTNSGITLEQIGVVSTNKAGTLSWTATYLVNNPSQILQFGESGISISAGDNLLEDTDGNATTAFSNFAVTNNSLVDSSGFTSQNFQRGTGGVSVYVSSSHGSDTVSFAQGQNPATPYRTVAAALKQLWANGMDGKGADIRLLRGDTFTSGGPLKMSGQDASHPFVIEDYWYAYGSNTRDPGSRPVIAIDETNTTTSDVFDTTSGGGTPATVNNVLIRRINLQAINWAGNYGSRYGLDFLRGGNNLTIDDCVVQNFGTNVVVQGYWSPFSNVTFLRDEILDARYDNSVVKQHSQGLYLDNVTGILISQCTFDDNGRVTLDRSGRDLYSHNIYIKETCGPAVVWGNTMTNGGSYGIEMRSGGVLAYNYLGANALGAFMDGVGGSQYKNVVENSQDISASLPRGFGLQMSTTYGNSISQVIEFNIIVNFTGSQQQAITVDQTNPDSIQNAIITHNTIVNAGGLKFNSNSATPSYQSVVDQYNIIDSGPNFVTAFPTYNTWGFYSAGMNVLNSTAKRNRITMIGNNSLTLANFTAATGGAESTSITLAPTYVNNTANIGNFYAAAGGTTSVTDYISMLRNRSAGNWGTTYDKLAVHTYYARQYVPTNLPGIGTGAFDFYGAVDYRAETSSGR